MLGGNMKIYFDESGQTGCVLLKKDMLNFANQPVFALGAVIAKDDNDERLLLEKYKKFKEKFKIVGEIKGSELTTRAKNEELNYFLKNILDSDHFAVNIYDKKFYLATLLELALIGREFQRLHTIQFYQIASQLSFEDDGFFVEYCRYVENPSPESFHKYLVYLQNYNYKYVTTEYNGIKLTAQAILDGKNEELFYDDFMTFGWYENSKISNLINLNALSELISFVKIGAPAANSEILYVHDKIDAFESTMKSELLQFGINISFPHENEPELLQLADNVASIYCHAYVKMKTLFSQKKEWAESSEWDMSLVSQLLAKIKHENIKFTVPIPDWAAALCIEQMYSPSYPKAMRKNIFFNPMYQQKQYEIGMHISAYQPMIDKISDVLKK